MSTSARRKHLTRTALLPWKHAQQLVAAGKFAIGVGAIAGVVLAVIVDRWLWLTLIFVMVAAWGWYAAYLATVALAARSDLSLKFSPVAPGYPSIPQTPAGAVASLMLLVTNTGAPVRIKASLVSRSVRGVGSIDYPDGDQVLRLNHPDSAELSLGPDETQRLDIAYVWKDHRQVNFLRPGDRLWATLEFDTTGFATCTVSVRDLDSGSRWELDLKLSMGTVDPPAVDVVSERFVPPA